MSRESCPHSEIMTMRGENYGVGPDVVLWACRECRLRFYPACSVCVDVGHRNVVHPALIEGSDPASPEPRTWSEEWDDSDRMCPNCVTPWKCNGPHLNDETPYSRKRAARSPTP